MTNQGTLYTVSAPSGAGKTSLVKALIESSDALCVSVSHTTRERRAQEVDGVNYHFIDHGQFQAMAAAGEFLEHAKVFSNYYGTSQTWVQQKLKEGSDVILEIDWQGAAQVRRILSEAVGVFILPPSKETLRARLEGRGQDDKQIIDARMAEAQNEISHYGEADYLVINDNFDQALEEFRSIVLAERLKLTNQCRRHQSLLENLLS